MSQAFDTLQTFLLASVPNYSAFRQQLKEIQACLTGEDLVRSRPILKIASALQDFAEQRAGTSDVTVLLRQVIRSHERRLRISRALWQVLSSREYDTGLRVTLEEHETVELAADPWVASWLPGSEAIDDLRLRRCDEPAVGNGPLARMMGSTYYQSGAQKAAVDACLFAPPGSTTLVTLPTGAGKSLCATLPAWLSSRGGQIKGGTTVVVVPTVALALDQERQAQLRFRHPMSVEHTPLSRTRATPEELKVSIRKGLRNGTLPLLFTSPEALLNSELYAICIEAAQAGTLNRLVIDEAHLVQTWGAGFRTEFQFLATFRKRLLEASGGRLTTLLLSATISRACDEMLESLFADSGRLNYIQGNRLRPEIAYWFNAAASVEERCRRVIEALRHLPRPLILYVTRPEQAEEWLRALRVEGFLRTATFSGQTDADERERIIHEWNNDQRDIIIATSAFGLGVDKPGVRSVIHACLPEDVDRFYQEVGRGGRDGYSAISLLLAAPGDEKLAWSMVKGSHISVEKAVGRWKGMQKRAESYEGLGDKIVVDIDAIPPYRLDIDESSANRDWNIHTLLLLQRARLIEITRTRDDLWNEGHSHAQKLDGSRMALSPGVPATAGGELPDPSRWLQIEILRPKVMAGPVELAAALEPAREQEKANVTRKFQRMKAIAETYASGPASCCLAEELAQLYPATALACGGCPYCRSSQRTPYSSPIPVSLDFAEVPTSEYTIDANLARLMGERKVLNVSWDGPRESADLQKLRPLLLRLIEAGFRQLIVPTLLLQDGAWASSIVVECGNLKDLPPQTIVSDEQAKSDPDCLYKLPTVIVYPGDDAWADDLYVSLALPMQHQWQGLPVINIVNYALYLESERGRFLDRINGLTVSSNRLHDILSAAHEEAYILE